MRTIFDKPYQDKYHNAKGKNDGRGCDIGNKWIHVTFFSFKNSVDKRGVCYSLSIQ